MAEKRLPGYELREAKTPSLGEILASFLPGIGDAMSLKDAYSTGLPLARALLSGDDMSGTGKFWGDFGLSALGAIPLLGMVADVGKGAKKLEAVTDALDMSEAARMKRAEELGFDTSKVYYHGTKGDIEAFDIQKAGTNTGATDERAIFFSDSPQVAEEYASYDIAPEDWKVLDEFDKDVMQPALAKEESAFLAHEKEISTASEATWQAARKEREQAEDAQIALERELLASRGRIYPVFLPRGDAIDMGGTSYSPLRMRQAVESADPVTYLANFSDSKAGNLATTAIVTDPSRIRSIFAAFDPAKKDSADLLAGLAPFAALPIAAALTAEEQNEWAR
jgi:hypothetical protein